MFESEEIELKLRAEVEKSEAPITGRNVACVLITQNGIYYEHNFEKEGSTKFEHAETRALEKALKFEIHPRILKIIMAGGGKINRRKNYVPCYYCFETLLPYVDDSTEIILMPLNEKNKKIIITFGELSSIYGDYPVSNIRGDSFMDIRSDLKNKTILHGIDLDFIASLKLFGQEHNVEFYLTGSTAGRGGGSSVLIKKNDEDYYDLDIIAVVKGNCDKVEQSIEEIILKYYKVFRKEHRDVPAYKNTEGEVIKKEVYYCGSPDSLKVLDFTFSTGLYGSFLYKVYYTKNWYHKLS